MGQQQTLNPYGSWATPCPKSPSHQFCPRPSQRGFPVCSSDASRRAQGGMLLALLLPKRASKRFNTLFGEDDWASHDWLEGFPGPGKDDVLWVYGRHLKCRHPVVFTFGPLQVFTASSLYLLGGTRFCEMVVRDFPRTRACCR